MPKKQNQLVSTMIELIENQGLIQKLGQNAQKKAFAKFDVNQIAHAVYTLQKNLIQSNK